MKNALTIAQTVWLEMIRKKEIYILLTIQTFFTFLLTTVNAFGTETPASYIMDIGLMLAFALSIALSILAGARQLPAEIRAGTLFSILTKPISRLEFLAGKFLGLWVGMSGATALFYAIVAGVTAAKTFSFSTAALAQTYALHVMLLAVVLAISLFFSTFVSQGAASTGAGIFTILCYLFVPRIPNLLAYEDGFRAGALNLIYFIAPHLELFDMRARVLHGWGPMDGLVFAGTVAYGLFLAGVFLALAWWIFRGKYFKRGEHL